MTINWSKIPIILALVTWALSTTACKKPISSQIEGYWGIDKESMLPVLANSAVDGIQNMPAGYVDKILNLILLKIEEGTITFIRPDAEEEAFPFSLISSDQATGDFTMSPQNNSDRQLAGNIKGDALQLDMSPMIGIQMKFLRLNDAEFSEKRKSIKNFNPEALFDSTVVQQSKELQQIQGLGIVIYAAFGNKFPAENLEETICAKLKGDQEEKDFQCPTRFKHPQTGEIRHVLYNRLHGNFSLEQKIMLASPWVYNNRRAVVLADGRGLKIDEKQYQLLIQKKGIDMQPIK